MSSTLLVIWNSKYLFITLLALQFIFDIFVYLNIPIVRQVLGFIYLTFVLGTIILRFLKLKKLSLAETIMLSVGLSIAFLMFFGLLINELCPIIGLSKPLSAEILIMSLNLFVILSCLAGYILERKSNVGRIHLHLPFLDLSTILAFVCLPILSVVGTILMNAGGDNSLLLLMIVVVPILALSVVLSYKKFSFDIFPIALLTIYIAILFATWLTTNYILGYDSHFEFYSFKLTDNASLWNPVRSFIEIDKGNAMLSITVLPTIYSKIINLDGTWIFKIVYPLLASLVPLGLYQLYLTQTRKEIAILGTFFFISNALDGLGSIKQWIASIFYVLLFFIMFSNKMSPLKKKILFIIFSGALVVSHYAISHLFLFIIFFTWAISLFFKKTAKVKLSFILISSSMAFAWYIFTEQSAVFDAVIHVAENIYRNLSNELFNPESRGATVMTGLGLIGPPTYIHLIGRLFFYLTEFLIVIGFATFLMKRRKMDFDPQFAIVASLNMAILLMTIAVPNLAEAFGMRRFYRTALVILAPLCVLGGEEILANIHKLRIVHPQKRFSALVLMLTIFTPFFLFQTGFVYEVTGVECWSLPLSSYRMPPLELSQRILYETEIVGAVWLSTHMDKNPMVYADDVSKFHVLTSYGLIDWRQFGVLSNTTTTIETGDFIYLRRLNIVNGIMEGDYISQWNTSDISSLLNIQNKIYSNGECDIYGGLG